MIATVVDTIEEVHVTQHVVMCLRRSAESV
jgi:hypothetical protein